MPNLSVKFPNSCVEIDFDLISGKIPNIKKTEISDHLHHVTFSYILDSSTVQDDWKAILKPNFQPDFHWAPHLTPSDKHVIDQHVFRSPALIVSNSEKVLILIPDLDILSEFYKKLEPLDIDKKSRWYLDLNAPNNHLIIGMCHNRVKEHVLFIKRNGAKYPSGEIQIGFYLMYFEDTEIVKNPWRQVLKFLWSRWGKILYEKGQPLHPDLTEHVELTYKWAFQNWRDYVWQEFTINGKKVGAPVFMVNATQSPNYDKPYIQREPRSIWNQAWFSSLRSASGLYRFAKRTNNQEYLEKSLLTKELALSSPQNNGFFPSVIGTDSEQIEIDGKKFYRPKPWSEFYWGNSNRNPFTEFGTNARLSPLHVLDMSWTALNMLRWYEELEQDDRLFNYAKEYAVALIQLQDGEGFFPAWLDSENLKPLGVLDQSPETSMSVTFLLKIYELTKEEQYKKSAIKAMNSIIKHIIPEGRWEDFETYWSCCWFGSDHVGKKFERNNMYKQCNFSMFWTAEALLECYRITNEKEFLSIGQRVLDEMLMTQASWQPPYMYVNTLGGFSVMNADGEWNDARQSLFAEVIVEYGLELKCKEYVQRGLAALRASFVLMYCPQNPKTKVQWEKAVDFFNEKDYGFMNEGYGHGGRADPNGLGMGDFNIYDWGNGSASEAFNRMLDHYGLDFLLQN